MISIGEVSSKIMNIYEKHVKHRRVYSVRPVMSLYGGQGGTEMPIQGEYFTVLDGKVSEEFIPEDKIVTILDRDGNSLELPYYGIRSIKPAKNISESVIRKRFRETETLLNKL